MSDSQKKRNRIARTSWIAPGKTSIERVTPRKRAGVWTIDWSVRLEDGRLLRRRSQGPTKSDARRAAWRTAQDILDGALDGDWRRGDSLTEYIAAEAIPRIKEAKLAPSSVTRYLRAARVLAGQCEDASHVHTETLRGYSIINGCKAKRLTLVLQDIAKTHGPEAAHQARSVLNHYVVDPLADHDELIPRNPLRGKVIRLEGEHRGHGGKRDVQTALTLDEYWQIVNYLLARGDHAPGTKPSRDAEDDAAAPILNARYSSTKWANARDLILLQAGTGMRVAEATGLLRDEVEDDGKTMIVPVPEARSKTGAPRRAAVVGVVAQHLRARQLARVDDVYVVAAPADGAKVWEPRARDRATARLYVEMADALGIELLRKDFRGHGWRHTINTLTADAVPVETRAALLGHTPEVNRQHYLDTRDLTAVARALDRTRTPRRLHSVS